MTKEDWQEIGSIFERLCGDGLFPALGYDANGWEAWAFFDEPVEGGLSQHIKVFDKTALGAMRALISEWERHSKRRHKDGRTA